MSTGQIELPRIDNGKVQCIERNSGSPSSYQARESAWKNL